MIQNSTNSFTKLNLTFCNIEYFCKGKQMSLFGGWFCLQKSLSHLCFPISSPFIKCQNFQLHSSFFDLWPVSVSLVQRQSRCWLTGLPVCVSGALPLSRCCSGRWDLCRCLHKRLEYFIVCIGKVTVSSIVPHIAQGYSCCNKCPSFYLKLECREQWLNDLNKKVVFDGENS